MVIRAMAGGGSPDEWQNSVVTNLSLADDSHRDAADTISGGFLSMRRTNADYGQQRDSVYAKFSQKIKNTEELSTQLASRILAHKKAQEHSEWSLQKLQAAMQDLQVPMELVRSRLVLRQRRPKRELIYDAFQQSLLDEERMLQTAKSRFAEAVAETNKTMRDLRQQREELEADRQDKQHALHIDMRCVDKKAFPIHSKLDKVYARKGVDVRVLLPEILGDPDEGTMGRSQERQRQKDTLRNIEAGLRLEAAARDRFQQTNNLLEQTNKAVQAAHQRTQAEMGAKIEHTELLRQELVKQRKATEHKISELQKCLGLTTEKHAFLEKPMTANQGRSRIRSRRTPREACADEVSEALNSQHLALTARREELGSQMVSMKEALARLETAHRSLVEDIADKEKALSLDRSCAGAKNVAHSHHAFGFSRVGTGQRHFADTASSRLRQEEMYSTSADMSSPVWR